MRLTESLSFRSGAALATLLAISACGDATAPELDEAVLADMAVVAADATLEDVTFMNTQFDFGPIGRFLRGPGEGRPGLPGGKFGLGSEFSGTRSVTFRNAGGVEQDRFDALTTGSIQFESEVSGDVERGPWTASIHRIRDLTISGLAGEETARTWNGSGSEEVSRSKHLDDGSERTYDATGTFTYTDVIVPVPGSGSRWPLSGTIQRSMDVTIVNGPRGDVTREVDVTITFDGDDTATAVINGTTTEIDLSARSGAFPLKRPFVRPKG